MTAIMALFIMACMVIIIMDIMAIIIMGYMEHIIITIMVTINAQDVLKTQKKNHQKLNLHHLLQIWHLT